MSLRIPEVRQPFDPATQLLTVSQVAAQLGVSPAMVYRLIRAGEVPSTKFGRAIRVPRDKLTAYVDQKTTGVAAAKL